MQRASNPVFSGDFDSTQDKKDSSNTYDRLDAMAGNALLMKRHLLKSNNVVTGIGEGFKTGRSDSLPIAGSYKPKKQRMEAL